MKRIVGAIVALGAVVAFGTVSSAATITFNVGGTSVLQTASQLAPPPGYFTSFFSAGSTITIDTDRNHDGTVGDVLLTAGTLYLNDATDLGDYGTFNTTATTYLSSATGTLNGSNQIVWDANTAFYANDPASTFFCTGIVCTLLGDPPGLTEGQVYPLQTYTDILAKGNVVPIDPFSLGTWQLDGSLTSFQATGPAFITILTTTQQPTSWYVFAGAVPEPGVLALTLLGLAGVALRARKA